nr:MAG TPA: hypothetical protein [Caudoviricetes sp.]
MLCENISNERRPDVGVFRKEYWSCAGYKACENARVVRKYK